MKNEEFPHQATNRDNTKDLTAVICRGTAAKTEPRSPRDWPGGLVTDAEHRSVKRENMVVVVVDVGFSVDDRRGARREIEPAEATVASRPG